MLSFLLSTCCGELQSLLIAFLIIICVIRLRLIEVGDKNVDMEFDMLKRGYSTKNLPKDPVDVIIIGSGIGGLASASLLSQRGYKVLVLEQHDGK